MKGNKYKLDNVTTRKCLNGWGDVVNTQWGRQFHIGTQPNLKGELVLTGGLHNKDDDS